MFHCSDGKWDFDRPLEPARFIHKLKGLFIKISVLMCITQLSEK